MKENGFPLFLLRKHRGRKGKEQVLRAVPIFRDDDIAIHPIYADNRFFIESLLVHEKCLLQYVSCAVQQLTRLGRCASWFVFLPVKLLALLSAVPSRFYGATLAVWCYAWCSAAGFAAFGRFFVALDTGMRRGFWLVWCWLGWGHVGLRFVGYRLGGCLGYL